MTPVSRRGVAKRLYGGFEPSVKSHPLFLVRNEPPDEQSDFTPFAFNDRSQLPVAKNQQALAVFKPARTGSQVTGVLTDDVNIDVLFQKPDDFVDRRSIVFVFALVRESFSDAQFPTYRVDSHRD